MGRSLLLTPELQAKFVEAVKAGIPAEHACAGVGINKETYYKWMQKGRKSESGDYFLFLQAIEGAKSLFVANLSAMLTNYIKKEYEKYNEEDGKFDPYLIMKVLNIKDRQNWGEKSVVEIEGGDKPVKIKTVWGRNAD